MAIKTKHLDNAKKFGSVRLDRNLGTDEEPSFIAYPSIMTGGRLKVTEHTSYLDLFSRKIDVKAILENPADTASHAVRTAWLAAEHGISVGEMSKRLMEVGLQAMLA